MYRTTDGSWHIDGEAIPRPPIAPPGEMLPIPADYSGGASAAELAVFDYATKTWHVEGQADVTDLRIPETAAGITDAVLLSVIRLTFTEECEHEPGACTWLDEF